MRSRSNGHTIALEFLVPVDATYCSVLLHEGGLVLVCNLVNED